MLSNFQLGTRHCCRFLIGQPELRTMMQPAHAATQTAHHRVVSSRAARQGRDASLHRASSKHVDGRRPSFRARLLEQIHMLTGSAPTINTLCNRLLLPDFLAKGVLNTRTSRTSPARCARSWDRTPRWAGARGDRYGRYRETAGSRSGQSVLQEHLQKIEERIDRLEKTVGPRLTCARRASSRQGQCSGQPTGR
jgi:hypothetical protein